MFHFFAITDHMTTCAVEGIGQLRWQGASFATNYHMFVGICIISLFGEYLCGGI